MSFNGSGTFQINSSGQPVVAGTVISDTVFNALTADLASGLSNCITKDGQQTVTANIPMGTYKFTGLGLGLSTTDSARMDNATAVGIQEGRIGSDTPNSGGGLRTLDAATTIYLSPYKGNKISLYNGTQWVLRSIPSASASIAVPATTATNYDVFAYDNAGTVTLELTAWASDTARATGLVYQDGVLVKSGTLTRRYLGTVRTGAVSGQVRDADGFRFVWNYYNQVPIRNYVQSTSTWTYTINTYRQANADTANQIDFVIGVADQAMRAWVVSSARNTGAGVAVFSGIGFDSTTVDAGASPSSVTQVANLQIGTRSEYTFYCGVGRHYLAWLEKSGASGTTTWNDTAVGGIYMVYLG